MFYYLGMILAACNYPTSTAIGAGVGAGAGAGAVIGFLFCAS